MSARLAALLTRSLTVCDWTQLTWDGIGRQHVDKKSPKAINDQWGEHGVESVSNPQPEAASDIAVAAPTSEAELDTADETPTPEEKASMAAYRQSLIESEKKGQESFDKTVLSLSGGALGISFLFIKDVIGPSQIVHSVYLLLAWSFWAASTLSVLLSFFTSNLSMRRAVKQCDEGKIHCEPPGGIYAKLTATFNLLGVASLIIGIGFMAAFVYTNLLEREKHHGRETVTPHTTSTPHATATPDTGTHESTASAGESR